MRPRYEIGRVRERVKELRERCFKSMNVLKRVSRTYYGTDRSTLVLFCPSIILSKPNYASFVYDSASDTAKRKLDTVQHAALRIVTGVFRTSPISGHLVEVHEPPLLFRRQLLAMRYALKMRNFPEHRAYPYIFLKAFLSEFEGT